MNTCMGRLLILTNANTAPMAVVTTATVVPSGCTKTENAKTPAPDPTPKKKNWRHVSPNITLSSISMNLGTFACIESRTYADFTLTYAEEVGSWTSVDTTLFFSGLVIYQALNLDILSAEVY